MITLYESECTDVSRSVPDDPRYHALTGIGDGCQYLTVEDADWVGPYLHGKYEVEMGYKDSDGRLSDQLLDEFLSQAQDWQWKVTTQRELLARPGDLVEFHPVYEAVEQLRIITIEETSDGDLTLELGARQPIFSDSWEAEQDLTSGYTNKYMMESHKSASATVSAWYCRDVAHDGAPDGELTFTVPAGALDTDLNPRVTLDLSINLETEKTLNVGSCAIEMLKSGAYLRYGNIASWTPGTDIQRIDITDWVAVGSNTITITIVLASEYQESHSAYTDHPQFSASADIKFWKRNA